MKSKLFLIFLFIFFIIYISISSPYPYHSAWDSSVLYAMDALIVGSNQPPDHFFHPNSIPLVFNKYIFLPLGKLLGLIQVSSITQLLTHSNPYIPFVEATKFLINLGYIYIIIFLLSIYLIYSKILSKLTNQLTGIKHAVVVIAIILISLTWGNLPYFLFWIRYETIGLVFWTLALYCVIRAAESPIQLSFFIVSGVLAGFSILSKIQFIGGVVIFPIFFASIVNFQRIRPQRHEKLVLFLLSLIIFIFISLIHYLSYISFIEYKLLKAAYGNLLTSKYFFPTLPLITLCYSLLVTYFVVKDSNRINYFIPYLFRFTLFLTGLFTPLLLSLCLGSTYSERTGSLYLTYIYSYMFGQRSMGFSPSLELGSFLPLMIPILLICLIVVYPKFRTIFLSDIKNKITISFSLLTIFLLYLSLTLVLRNDPAKDGMIKDLWIGLSFVIIWRVFSIFVSVNKAFYIGCAASCILFLFQLKKLINYQRLNYTYTSWQSDYYYDTPLWQSSSLGFRGEQYRNLMQGSYPTTEAWQYVFQWSQQLAELKLLLFQVFRARSFNLNKSSIVFEGSVLFNKHAVSAFSTSLTGALLIPYDSANVSLIPRADFEFYLISSVDSLSTNNAFLTDLLFKTKFLNKDIKFSVYKIGPGPLDIVLPKGIFWIAIKNKNTF
jgi:hypothetical protein